MNNNCKGFTLVELLISFAIISILIGALYPAFGDFGKKQAVIQAAENFKNDLEITQLKSVSGVTAGAGGGYVRWAIQLDCNVAGGAKSYRSGYFIGNNFTSTRTENLESNISITNCGSSGVIFERITGKVEGLSAGATKTFTFSSSNVVGSSKSVILEERGQLTLQ